MSVKILQGHLMPDPNHGGCKMSGKSLVEHVKMVERRRLINSEYQRGFMEGQQKAAKEFAVLIDNMLGRYDHIAIAGGYMMEREPC